MLRLATIAVLLLSPTAGFAAGYQDEAFTFTHFVMASPVIVTLAMVAAGSGFLLQTLMRLRLALILLAIANLALLALVAVMRHGDVVLACAAFSGLIWLFFGPVFGLGWYLGTRQMRPRARQELA